ncbi:MAG: anti sigma factor C-terminal domain-containing protein [Clostridium sp.]|uniref:anti sigma factor C-terminal domain-containing protein n=1 Tax=Clostridium sp. TaxID=1506 RepID=UPI0029119AD0|nr:anti sigma factor C-terminal domain-containing protein [Clostridium sp.]MDU5111951.1 anti sigma factor C-terminal domain-containing protein [Clostridium sp.]
MKDIDNFLDEKKLKKSIRRAKIKLTIKIIVISVIVFIMGSLLNNKLSLKYSELSYEKREAIVKLTIPNGYISESNDLLGLLGGTSFQKISKSIAGRKIIIDDSIVKFGINGNERFSRFDRVVGSGTGNYNSDWPVNTNGYGYKKLRFFHPELQYKDYQNDLDYIDKIPDGKILEVAISFDRPYKISDLYMIQNKLSNNDITWLWLDEFTKIKIDEFKYAIENYDSKSAGIEEIETIGIECYDSKTFNRNDYNEKYDELIEFLDKSPYMTHKELYDEIMERGMTSADDAEILGVVVHGTKEELKEIVGLPIIKASSFGIITEPVY